MAKVQGKGHNREPISLLLAEGVTDELFWQQVKDSSLKGCRIITRDLKGNFNINKKVVAKAVGYCEKHLDERVRIYCCIDRESREGKAPGFELKTIVREICERNIKSVLSIDAIIATQQIESWFFWDMETIYKCLNVRRSQRKKNAYRPPERYTYHDMIKLFRNNGKAYNKGKRCGYFIQQLNLDRIIENCRELREGIEKIKSQANDTTNHLF
ncbi:MAG: DUF4276 family protein [Planctomycetes bacterium]|nr:DUF4276 family protein [Planctomycetota bacterium]